MSAEPTSQCPHGCLTEAHSAAVQDRVGMLCKSTTCRSCKGGPCTKTAVLCSNLCLCIALSIPVSSSGGNGGKMLPSGIAGACSARHSRWTGACRALHQLSGKQARELYAQRQRCSAAARASVEERALALGRVAVEAAALPLLVRLLHGGLCHGPRGGGDRTKLGKCLAHWLDLLFGELFHSFDV